MNTNFISRFKSVATRLTALTLGFILWGVATSAFATSSWNPTLLVNTESFNTIDQGDNTTDMELRFGETLGIKLIYDRANNRFDFNRSLFIHGNLTATGALKVIGSISGSSLRIDNNVSVGGKLSVSGATLLRGTATISGSALVNGATTLSGTTTIKGATTISNTLTTSGAIKTNGNITINNANANQDATLTFGNNAGAKTLNYNATSHKFEFNAPLRVYGSISGSTLNVDGSLTINGQTYNFPSSQTAGGFLKTDGNGTLTWTTSVIGNGSGELISLQPTYANAIYFSSGSSYIGQLSASGSSALNQNYYHWVTSRSGLQNYWIAVRVRVPDNFSSWDPIKPIELLYRTADGTATNNHVTVRMRDTAGTEIALSNGGGLTNATTFTTANITGPQAGGTWTKKGYFTVYVKLSALTGKYADVGYLNFNFENTNP